MLHDELRLAVACGTTVLGVEEGVKHCEATAAVLRLSSMELLRSQCIPVKCCGRLSGTGMQLSCVKIQTLTDTRRPPR